MLDLQEARTDSRASGGSLESQEVAKINATHSQLRSYTGSKRSIYLYNLTDFFVKIMVGIKWDLYPYLSYHLRLKFDFFCQSGLMAVEFDPKTYSCKHCYF